MWENYLARNNSHITDIFCGQLRSRVVCATCKKVRGWRSGKSTAEVDGQESNCYDPFMDLSLPIPKKFQVGPELTWLVDSSAAGAVKVAIKRNRMQT
eukprot:750859-Hanusia_phi.AAC.1